MLLRSRFSILRPGSESLVTAAVVRNISSAPLRVSRATLWKAHDQTPLLWRQNPASWNVASRLFSSLPSHSALSMPALSPTMTQGNIGDLGTLCQVSV